MGTLGYIHQYLEQRYKTLIEVDSGRKRTQGLVYEFAVPEQGFSGLIPRLRIFGRKPATMDCLISSVSIGIGRNERQEKLRDESSKFFFGMPFDQLRVALKSGFPIREPDRIMQITCGDPFMAEAFVEQLINYYQW